MNTRIEWPDADHPTLPKGYAFAFSRTLPIKEPVKVCVCGSHLSRESQIKLRDWLTEQIER